MKIKNCPFCNGQTIEHNTPQCDAFIKRSVKFWLRCENECVEQFLTYETPLQAIRAWNKRVKNKILCKDCALKFDCIYSFKAIVDCTSYRRPK